MHLRRPTAATLVSSTVRRFRSKLEPVDPYSLRVTFPLSVASNHCTQSPSHSEIVPAVHIMFTAVPSYERGWMTAGISALNSGTPNWNVDGSRSVREYVSPCFAA